MCVYLVLLAASLLVVVEDVLADVLPARVLRRDVVDAALLELTATALLVPHCHRHQHSYRGQTRGAKTEG